ncbi:MAG: hypothetical protein RBR34_08445 [Rhodospirillaceae bacterium]|nr:hypothetical protein [Rhodospirillaceae bacterium]
MTDRLEAGQPGGDYFGHLVLRARTEAARASAKFPQPNYVTLKIAEESGEVVRAAIHYAEGRMGWPEVEGEIVQLLAMLIRFVTEGDGVIGVVPPVELGRLTHGIHDVPGVGLVHVNDGSDGYNGPEPEAPVDGTSPTEQTTWVDQRAREWEEACRARGDANRDRLTGRQSVYEAAEKRAKGKEG